MSMMKRWLAGAVALAGVLGVAGDAGAETRLAIKPRPTAPSFLLTESPTSKLMADLVAVVAAKADKAKLVGVTVQGEAIVEFGADVTPQAATTALAEAPRNVSTRLFLEHQPYEKATQLIVVYSGKEAPKEAGGLKVVDTHTEGQFVVVQSANGFTAEQLEKLADDKKVRLVQPNYIYHLVQEPSPTAATTVPNDPLFAQLWGMKNINAPIAWNKIRSSLVPVAVIDTGINQKHKDLSGNIVPNLSKDFTTDNDPADGVSHGSHCTGTIAAVGNNSLGVAGVMWKGHVFAAKIFSKTGSFAGDVQVAKAIDYAVGKGAKVLSNSWGGGAASPVLQAAISRADLKGVLFIAAAGNGDSSGNGVDNDSVPFYPASYPNKNIISVLAINVTDHKTAFSNYGKTTVDIGAPGEGIISTVLNQAYGSKSGTSMATPHVAGAAALIWGHPQYKNHTHLQIKALILRNARRLPDLTNKCVTSGTLDLKFLGALPAVTSEETKID